MPAHRLNTVQVYGIRDATETVDSPARALVPDPGVLAPTLARVDPTTPTRAGQPYALTHAAAVALGA